jgi:regulator of RNase E activity RraA
VCVIPFEAREEIFRMAFEKASAEKRVRKNLENGMSAVAVFERDGIL